MNLSESEQATTDETIDERWSAGNHAAERRSLDHCYNYHTCFDPPYIYLVRHVHLFCPLQKQLKGRRCRTGPTMPRPSVSETVRADR